MALKTDQIKKLLKKIIMFLICLAVSFWCVSIFTTNYVMYSFDSLRVADWIVVVLVSCALFIGISVLKKHTDFEYLKELLHIFPSETKLDYLHLCFCAVILFVFYMLGLTNPYDYPRHILAAVNFDFTDFFSSICSLPYPLWHLLSAVSSKILKIPITYTCSAVSAVFYLLTYLITRRIISSIAVRAKTVSVDVLSFALMFVQPLHAPWFNINQYSGQGTPNVWHNPTTTVVQPFALIYLYILYTMIYHWKDEDKHFLNINSVRLIVINLISVFAKPSHAQVAIPATGVILLFMLLNSKGKCFRFSLRIALTWVPAVLWMGFVFYNSFINGSTNSGNGVGISIPPFDVWASSTPSVPISILLAAGTPIFIFLFFLFKRNSKNNFLFMTFVFLLVAILEFGYIAETGGRRYDGNFSWGYILSLSQIWVYSSGFFLDSATSEESEAVIPRSACRIITVLIALHFMFGIKYLIACFQGSFV